MIKQFVKGEGKQYLEWIGANPGGFIWIEGHGKLHKANCPKLIRWFDVGKRAPADTEVKRKAPRSKVWGATREELLDWLWRERGKTPTAYCQICLKGENPGSEPAPNHKSEMEPTKWPTMKELLDQFRQVILYGPPGTGKTREAKRTALAILSGKERAESAPTGEIDKQLEPFRKDKRFELVVFHPAYEYEQFVGGIEPIVRDGTLAFQVKGGIFLQLCRRAEQRSTGPHAQPVVLVIDEINRGNLPKLLGELVYALEYRDQPVTLPFVWEERVDLTVPGNLYIIATMNSADRSIGHIDVAIRRRFGLCHVGPDSEVIRKVWHGAQEESYGERLVKLMEQLNAMLNTGNDRNAEAEMGIGHSYFLPNADASGEVAQQQVRMKWEHQVQPLLREYAQLLNLGADTLGKWLHPLDQVLPQP